MKKNKILAAVSAVITAVLLLIFLSGIKTTDNNKTESIVTAKTSIPSNSVITDEMIEIKEIPEEAVISGALRDQSLVIGKTAKSEILPGEQILEARLVLAGDSASDTLAYAITPGMRAVTIAVSSTTGLSGMIKPRDRVDIIGDFEYQDTVVTSMVLENIKVLAVDNVLSEEGKTSSGEEASAYSTITIEVTPVQSVTISNTAYTGQLRAVLRSPLDEGISNPSNITLKQALEK